jgi:hypothetical protein
MESWDDYLDPGERLLWTGAPAIGLRFTPRGIATSLGSLFLLGFALFWTFGAGMGLWSGEWREADGFMRLFMIVFPLFGLPFIAAGLYGVIGHYFADARKRARTRYALTTRRALIAENGKERMLRSWPILPDTVVDFLPGPEARNEASIRFATEVQVDSEGDKTHTRTGFELIPDGDTVMRLIRQIQTATAQLDIP